MQIDNPKRGFSFKTDGPLDLRLNQEAGISAAERLEHITRDELAGMLYENSDEPYCEELAKQSQMRSARETTWIPPQSFARSLRKLWIPSGKREEGDHQKDLPAYLPGTAY